MILSLPNWPSGTLIGGNRYRIEEPLGMGGAGVVYRATLLALQKLVAIKVSVATDTTSLQALREEATVMLDLRHPHLPGFLDFFIEEHQPCLVMGFIPGQNLQEKLAVRNSPFSESETLHWFRQILDAVAYLHNQQPPVIHRDIKPSNIRIKPNGSAVLVDFGIAKIGGSTTQTRLMAQGMGTAPFAPWEQYGGSHTDTYSDVYALGATLYVLLTNTFPPEAISRKVNDTLIPPRTQNAQISQQTEQIMIKALAPHSQMRFLNAGEFLSALNNISALNNDNSKPASSLSHPSGPATQRIDNGRPCPRCNAASLADQPFCPKCGTPILLRFPKTSRLLADTTDLVDVCDTAWEDAVEHVRRDTLRQWLEARGETQWLLRLQQARESYPNNVDAAMECFLRPAPTQDLAAERQEIDLGTCAPGQRPTLSVTLRWSQPGYIHGTVRAEGQWLNVAPATIQARTGERSLLLSVKVNDAWIAAGDAYQAHTGMVYITTNRGSLTLPARLMVSNPPKLHLQSGQIDLGRIEARQQASGSTIIVNTGGGTINGSVRGAASWLTIEAQQAHFTLGYRQQHTAHFGITASQLTPQGIHRSSLIWETDAGTAVTNVQVEVTPPYLVDQNNPATAITKPANLIQLCDCEREKPPHAWERGIALLQSGKITAALHFFKEEELMRASETLALLADINIGLERLLRRLGAKKAERFEDNSRDVLKQISGLLSRKPRVIEYAILNTSKRGYLHGYVRPLVDWLRIPEPHFGCLPDQEAIIKLEPDYTKRRYTDLFEIVLE
jgi:serine/threonine-protein kinase